MGIWFYFYNDIFFYFFIIFFIFSVDVCVYQIAQIFYTYSFLVLFFLQSAKNPANARRVIIVLLNGQKLEVMCDPSTTGKQLFQTVISHMALHEIQSYFGLTYIYGNKLILSFKNIFSYISHCLFFVLHKTYKVQSDIVNFTQMWWKPVYIFQSLVRQLKYRWPKNDKTNTGCGVNGRDVPVPSEQGPTFQYTIDKQGRPESVLA